jgi:energy-coupling factor transporter transmembrane protein EcfT
METIRKPFQGVGNIIRFNWHFYVLSACSILILSLIGASYGKWLLVLPFVISTTTLVSLIVSWYVYDFSDLYNLNWLKTQHANPSIIVNITAGFDEISPVLKGKFPLSKLKVFDFYNALPQKEISIQRAQKAYPAYVSTESILLSSIPLKSDAVDMVFLFLAAHEIRNDNDRGHFFYELERILCTDGNIFVLEHTRDVFNFLAYTIGFLHFFSKSKWLKTFAEANFKIESHQKITPFINLFILTKNGNSF